MDEIINKFSLTDNMFIQEIHLKQPKCTYSTCGLFTKNKQRIQTFKEAGFSDSKCIKLSMCCT